MATIALHFVDTVDAESIEIALLIDHDDIRTLFQRPNTKWLVHVSMHNKKQAQGM